MSRSEFLKEAGSLLLLSSQITDWCVLKQPWYTFFIELIEEKENPHGDFLKILTFVIKDCLCPIEKIIEPDEWK